MTTPSKWHVSAVSIALIATVTSGLEAREVYRWVDAQGVVHLSDTPPTVGDSQRLTVRLPPPASSAPVRHTPAPVAVVADRATQAPAPTALPVANVAPAVTSPPYATPAYGWRVISVLSAPPVSDPALGDAQRQALAARGLSGPRRPLSINSSGHAQRVARSQGLNGVTEPVRSP